MAILYCLVSILILHCDVQTRSNYTSGCLVIYGILDQHWECFHSDQNSVCLHLFIFLYFIEFVFIRWETMQCSRSHNYKCKMRWRELNLYFFFIYSLLSHTHTHRPKSAANLFCKHFSRVKNTRECAGTQDQTWPIHGYHSNRNEIKNYR